MHLNSEVTYYIANKFNEYPILHHHLEGAGYLYTYPRVQYKILEGTAIILGIEEGVEVLKEISGKINELALGKNVYKIEEKRTIEKDQNFGESEEKQYRFVTPWLALNEENFGRYKRISKKEQILLLHRILIGNILSMSKSLDYVVTSEIKVKTNVKPVKVHSKVIMTGFAGEFEVNFELPDFIGLGKSVSMGFGTIRRS